VNVCLKKFKFDKAQAYSFADTVMNKVDPGFKTKI